jgi:hypothetical protein
MYKPPRTVKTVACETCRVYKLPREFQRNQICSLCSRYIHMSCKQCVKVYRYHYYTFYICNPCQKSAAYVKPCDNCGETKRPYDWCKTCKLAICKPCQQLVPPSCTLCPSKITCVGCAANHMKPCRRTITVPNEDGNVTFGSVKDLLGLPFPTIVTKSIVPASSITTITCPFVSCNGYYAIKCSMCGCESRHVDQPMFITKSLCCCCYYSKLMQIWAFRLTEINIPPVLLQIINDYGRFIDS